MTGEIADRRTQIVAAAAVSTAGLVRHNLAEFPVRILIGPETLDRLVSVEAFISGTPSSNPRYLEGRLSSSVQ